MTMKMNVHKIKLHGGPCHGKVVKAEVRGRWLRMALLSEVSSYVEYPPEPTEAVDFPVAEYEIYWLVDQTASKAMGIKQYTYHGLFNPTASHPDAASHDCP